MAPSKFGGTRCAVEVLSSLTILFPIALSVHQAIVSHLVNDRARAFWRMSQSLHIDRRYLRTEPSQTHLTRDSSVWSEQFGPLYTACCMSAAVAGVKITTKPLNPFTSDGVL